MGGRSDDEDQVHAETREVPNLDISNNIAPEVPIKTGTREDSHHHEIMNIILLAVLMVEIKIMRAALTRSHLQVIVE